MSTATTTTRKTTPNKYAATCADCGQRVAEAAGSLTRENGKWIVRHLTGACTPATPADADGFTFRDALPGESVSDYMRAMMAAEDAYWANDDNWAEAALAAEEAMYASECQQ